MPMYVSTYELTSWRPEDDSDIRKPTRPPIPLPHKLRGQATASILHAMTRHPLKRIDPESATHLKKLLNNIETGGMMRATVHRERTTLWRDPQPMQLHFAPTTCLHLCSKSTWARLATSHSRVVVAHVYER